MADRDLRIRVILSKVGDLIAPLRGIAAQSSRTGKALKVTQGELKALKRTQAEVAGFRELKVGLRGTEAELAKAQARVNGLARAIDAADKPTRKLTAEFANAKKFAAALKTSHGEQSAKLHELRARLSAAGVSTGQLAEHERRLRGDVARTTDQLEAQRRKLGQLAQQERRLGAARRQVQRNQALASNLAIGGAATGATGLSILGPVKGAIEEAGRYEAIMTSIGQKGELSRAATTRLGQQVASIAGRVNQLPAALAEGADVLVGFGLKPGQVAALLAPIGKASTAYKAEILDLSKASFAVVDNLKVPFGQTGRAIDIMATAGKRGAFELKDMAQYFPALSASAAALGQTGAPAVADLAAALQITRKGAGDSATAANNLQNLLAKIASPATVEKFGKLGVDLLAGLKRAAAEGKTPLEAIIELTRKATGGDMSKIGNLFEDMQVQQALRPLMMNTALYRQIRAEALAANGTTERDFAERMKDAEQQSRKLEAATQALKIKIGTQLLPIVVELAIKLNAAIDRVSAWAERNPQLAKSIVIAAIVAGVLLTVVGGLMIAISAVLGPFALLNFALVSGIPGLIKFAGFARLLGLRMLAALPAVWSFTAALLANPLTWVVLAVAGVVALAAAIYNHWGAISGFLGKVWAGFKASGASIWAWMTSLTTQFTSWGGNIIQGIIDGIGGKLGALKSAVTGAASAAAGWFRKALGINSPSRVFAGFGVNLMDGLAGGIDASRSRPVRQIDRLARQLTLGVTIPARMAATPARIAATAPMKRAATQPAARILAQMRSLPAAPARVEAAAAARRPVIQPAARALAQTRPLPTAAAAPVERLQALSRDLIAALAIGAATASPAAASPVARPASAAPPAAGPTTNHFHITQLPGESADDLARKIGRILDDRDRARRAATRSSLADLGD